MLNLFGKGRGGGDEPHLLVVGMTGVRLGERVAHIGCAHGGRLAAVARKTGLSGRAVAIVPDDASAARARKGAAEAGVLVEIDIAPPTRLPADDAAFDLVVIDDTAGLLGTMSTGDRAATVREALRLLRPGGRIIVIGSGRPVGLGRLLGRGPAGPQFDAAPALQADGFRSVRQLAERDGLVFVEGIKPRP
ncbi:MAG: methyltransferase domain-containing protein [Acidobacteriota bacterium]